MNCVAGVLSFSHLLCPFHMFFLSIYLDKNKLFLIKKSTGINCLKQVGGKGESSELDLRYTAKSRWGGGGGGLQR